MNYIRTYTYTSSSTNSTADTSSGWYVSYNNEPVAAPSREEKVSKKTEKKGSPKEMDLSPFVRALMHEPCLGDVSRLNMAVVTPINDPIQAEMRKVLGRMYRHQIEYHPQKAGEYLSHLGGYPIILLIDVVNMFPTYMEVALLLREALDTVGCGNHVLIKALCNKSVYLLAAKNGWEKVGELYTFKNERGKLRVMRGFEKEELIELAMNAGFKGVRDLKELSKLEDPCIIVN